MEASSNPNSNSKTIPAHKSAFLRSQIRLLSSILQPSSTWRNDPSSLSPSKPTITTDLPPSTLNPVLTKLNTHLQSHNSLTYPPQTQRHIAEQIDALYWADVSSEGLHPVGADEVVVGRDVDLATPEGFESLPRSWGKLFVVEASRWHGGEQGGGEEVERMRYEALRERLGRAIEEQARERERLEGYRRLETLVQGLRFAGGGAQQGGFVDGKEGELGREMERLRSLVGKVAERVGEVGGREAGDDTREEKGDGTVREREMDQLRNVMDVL